MDVNARARRQPHWPDRAAHLRRRRARKVFWVVVALLVVLPWLGYRSVRDWIGPGAADPPASPVATTITPTPTPKATAALPPRAEPGADAVAEAPVAGPGRADTPAPADGEVAALGRDARRGDEGQVVARLAGLDARAHRDAMLADRGSAIRREAGRRDVEAMPGVRAAGWVDRMSMVVVTSGGANSYQTISEACRRLGTQGDVTGVAITVQDIAVGARRPAASLSAQCAPRAADDALLQIAGGRVLPGRALGAVTSAPTDGDDAALEARRLRQLESLRILSESTPALPDPR